MEPQFIINPIEVARRSKQPHPPTHFENDAERKEMAASTWKIQRGLESVLKAMGFTSNLGMPIAFESDFYMNDDVGTFRSLSFEILTRRMIKRELLVRVAEYLQRLDQDYSVFISCDIGESTELFMIIVTKDTAFGQFEESETAAAFGFDSTSELIGPIE